MKQLIVLAMVFGLSSQVHAQAVDGKKHFAMCGACHSVDGSVKPMGPTLKGILNRQAATVGDYKNYSKAMKASNIVWSEKELDLYLAAPGKRVAGTSMMIGVADAKKRKAIIDYLKTLK